MVSNIILNVDLQQGDTFEYPEVVPFRLTHNMVEAMVSNAFVLEGHVVVFNVFATLICFVYINIIFIVAFTNWLHLRL